MRHTLAIVVVVVCFLATSCGDPTESAEETLVRPLATEQSASSTTSPTTSGDPSASSVSANCTPATVNEARSILAGVVSSASPQIPEEAHEAAAVASSIDEIVGIYAVALSSDPENPFGTTDVALLERSLREWFVLPPGCDPPVAESVVIDLQACVDAVSAAYRGSGEDPRSLTISALEASAEASVAISFETPVPAARLSQAVELDGVAQLHVILEGYLDGTALSGTVAVQGPSDVAAVVEQTATELRQLIESDLEQSTGATGYPSYLDADSVQTLERLADSITPEDLPISAVVLVGTPEALAEVVARTRGVYAVTSGPTTFEMNGQTIEALADPILAPDLASLEAWRRLCAEDPAAAVDLYGE